MCNFACHLHNHFVKHTHKCILIQSTKKEHNIMKESTRKNWKMYANVSVSKHASDQDWMGIHQGNIWLITTVCVLKTYQKPIDA